MKEISYFDLKIFIKVQNFYEPREQMLQKFEKFLRELDKNKRVGFQ